MYTLGFQNQTPTLYKFFTLSSSLTTFFFASLSQFSLTLIPYYFPSSPLLLHLPLSALLLLTVTGLGNASRRLIGFSASAPAFVFFNILFIWGTYITIIQKGVSWLWGVAFNAECVLLVIGLYSIICSDPGLVAQGGTSLKEIIRDKSSGIKSLTEEEGLVELVACLEKPVVNAEECSSIVRRVRYCKYCRAYIREFDHHCPAFSNCIGQNNHLLFMALLVGFVMVEASYTVCSTQYIEISRRRGRDLLESKPSMYLVISTRLFSILQVIWQINWRKYPEFHDHIQLQPLHPNQEPRFRNPYDKGILRNINEFLSP